MTGTAKFCQDCGATLSRQSQFCEECGKAAARSGFTNFVRIRELFDQAVAIDPSQRQAWLEQECAGDTVLLDEVRGLLPRSQDPPHPGAPSPVVPGPGAPSTTHASNSRNIGRYRILRELGRGGMGVVYLAARDDGAFHKNVALKLLLSEQVTPEFIQRFKQERQVIAAMEHANIARILDAGDAPGGMPYYVMEYVEGLPVDKYCDDKQLSLTARIQVFQQICAAVHYLHEKAIVHRDLKPANILVSQDGLVKLIDFGIAKMVGAGASANPELTSVQGAPMTLNYASPEQIQGVTLQKTSDIYSLGVILYLLLTGHPPYASWEAKQGQLATRQPPPVPSGNLRADLRATPESTAQLRKALLGGLDSIVLMALRHEARERYQSAADLSHDLQRFLDGESITAYPDSVGSRSRRILWRQRAAIGVFAGFLALGGFGIWQWRLRETQKSEATQREAELRQVLDQLEAGASAGKPDNEKLGNVQKLMQAFTSQFPAVAANQPRGASPPQDLLARGVRYLDRLVTVAPNDVDLGMGVADAYRQLGKLEENVATQPATAVGTYQKAAQVLNTSLAKPGGSRAAERLAQVNQSIERLGGGVVPAAVVPQPEANPPVLTVPEPVATKPEPGVRKAGNPKVKPLANSQEAAGNVRALPAPLPEAASAPRVAPVSAALEELRDRYTSVESRIMIAEQTLEPLKRTLEAQGQTLNSATQIAMSNMRTQLNRAKRELAAGNEGGAREALEAAQAFADRVLKSVGR